MLTHHAVARLASIKRTLVAASNGGRQSAAQHATQWDAEHGTVATPAGDAILPPNARVLANLDPHSAYSRIQSMDGMVLFQTFADMQVGLQNVQTLHTLVRNTATVLQHLCRIFAQFLLNSCRVLVKPLQSFCSPSRLL